jgi:hypothetical protein
MLVSVTSPELVTTPLIVWASPTTAVAQFLVISKPRASVITQMLVADAVTGVPQTLLAVAVTTLVYSPQAAVKLFV